MGLAVRAGFAFAWLAMTGCWLSWTRAEAGDDDDTIGDLDDDDQVDAPTDDDPADDEPIDDGEVDPLEEDPDCQQSCTPDEVPPDPEVTPWATEVIDGADSSAESVALAVDDESSPHLVYVWSSNAGEGGDDEWRYATKDGDAWVVETIGRATPTGFPAVVAVDAAGDVEVAMLRDDSSGRADRVTVTRAVRSRDGWQIEDVDGPSRMDGEIGMALDAAGAMHLTYAVGDECADRVCTWLRYATNASGTWVIEEVDPSQDARMAGIALDAEGSPRIAFVAGERHDAAWLATRSPRGWELEEVAPVGADDLLDRGFGGSVGLVVDPDGANHLFVPGRALVHADDTSGDWATESIPSSGDGGSYNPAAVLGLDGVFHLSWVELGPPAGNVYQWGVSTSTGAAGDWSSEVVEPWAPGGTDVALALDPRGTLHMAYVDRDAQIVYATRDP